MKKILNVYPNSFIVEKNGNYKLCTFDIYDSMDYLPVDSSSEEQCWKDACEYLCL